MRRGWRGVALLAGILAWGCGEKAAQPEAQGGLGQQAGDAAHDTAVLKRAMAAANEVIRAGGDCEAVEAGLEAAETALEEAGRQIRTATGRTSLETLRRQVREISQACP